MAKLVCPSRKMECDSAFLQWTMDDDLDWPLAKHCSAAEARKKQGAVIPGPVCVKMEKPQLFKKKQFSAISLIVSPEIFFQKEGSSSRRGSNQTEHNTVPIAGLGYLTGIKLEITIQIHFIKTRQ